MRYRKEPIRASEEEKTVVVPLREEEDGVVSRSFGFACRGTLACGEYGAERLAGFETLPQGETAAAIYRVGTGQAAAVLACCRGGSVYVGINGGGLAQSAVTFSMPPAAARVFGGQEGVLLSDGAACALLTAGGLQKEEDIPPFSGAAYAHERLWLLSSEKSDRLLFSAPADIRDFSESRGTGGRIDLPDAKGKIAALCAFGGDLYLFRERGVQRLRARGDERDFEITDVFDCCGIYPKTAAAAPFGIAWLAKDGLYRFDGNRCARVPLPFRFAEEQAGAQAVAAEFGYVLSARIAAEKGEADAVCVSEDGESCVVLPFGGEGLTSCAGEAYFVRQGEPAALRKRFVRGCASRWASAPVRPFGKRSRLSRVRIRAEGAFWLEVRADGKKRGFLITGNQTAAVNLAGEEFAFALESDGAGRIASIEAAFTAGG